MKVSVPGVRQRRIEFLTASVALEHALKSGSQAEVNAAVAFKEECLDEWLEACRAVDPTCFDLPRVSEQTEGR